MALDTSALNKLIADFRALSQKDSISPESLGSLLQRLADLIAGCTSDIDAKPLFDLLNSIKPIPDAILSISQGSAHPNNVLVNISKAKILNGVVSSLYDQLFIRQATTDCAGAMGAQHVSDLNAAKKAVTDIKDALNAMAEDIQMESNRISSLGSNLNSTQDAVKANKKAIEDVKASTLHPTVHPILEAVVQDRKLVLINAKHYLDLGLIPYVFRRTKKRNANHHDLSNEKYGLQHKGWHVIGGGKYCISIDAFNIVSFADSPLASWHNPYINFDYSSEPETLVQPHRGSNDKVFYVRWGRSKVYNWNVNTDNKRLLRFEYAIGFGKEYERDRIALHTSDLVSNIALFAVVYDTASNKWYFTK